MINIFPLWLPHSLASLVPSNLPEPWGHARNCPPSPCELPDKGSDVGFCSLFLFQVLRRSSKEMFFWVARCISGEGVFLQSSTYQVGLLMKCWLYNLTCFYARTYYNKSATEHCLHCNMYTISQKFGHALWIQVVFFYSHDWHFSFLIKTSKLCMNTHGIM